MKRDFIKNKWEPKNGLLGREVMDTETGCGRLSTGKKVRLLIGTAR